MLALTTSARMREPGVTRPGAATRSTVQVLGAVAAFTGIEHGIGEVTQGWAAPSAVVFESWRHVEAFDPLNGEPAMSLVPNLLVSGVLTIVVALMLGFTAVRADRAHLGATLIGLSLMLLLVGGGFGPPLLGVLSGGLALRIHAPSAGPPGPVPAVVARTYPWPLAVAVACFVGLVPGTALTQIVVAGDLSPSVAIFTLGAFAGTALAMWSARARDRADGAAREGSVTVATLQHRETPTPAARSRIRVWPWRLLLVVLLVATAVTAAGMVATPRAAIDDVPADVFSAARAMQDLAVVAAEPHPIGSPAQREVRDYLVGEARSLGLPVQVQRDPVSGGQNVIVRLEGTANTGRDVLITSHYDSAPGAPGAGDDGISVAGMVETMRVLHASDPLRNDIVLLFTDGEEQGQTGIAAFVQHHPAADRVGVAFVFEALPESGGTELRTTTPGDAWLVGELADASLPVFTTSANNSSDRARIGNDFAAFAPAGIVAAEFLTKGDRVRYHNAGDHVAAVDPGVVQDHGETMLALVRHFGALDLSAATVSDHDLVFFAAPADTLVAYPVWLAQTIALAAAVAFVVVVALLARRRKVLRLGRVLMAAGVVIGLVAIGAAAAWGAWQALLALNPGSASTLHHADFETATAAMYMIYAVVGVAFLAACGLLGRWLGGLELAAGALVWWMLGAVLVSFGEPLFSPVLLWPFVGGVVALAVAAFVRSEPATAVLLAVAAAPTLVVAVPLLMLEALDVEEGTMVAVPILLLLLGALLPIILWVAGRLPTPALPPQRT